MTYGKRRWVWMGLICLLAAGLCLQAAAQTKEKGPWWPHPIGATGLGSGRPIRWLQLDHTGKGDGVAQARQNRENLRDRTNL